MSIQNQIPTRMRVPASVTILMIATMALTGCGNSSKREAAMTSYSRDGGSQPDKAQLFSVPTDQAAHLQLVAIEPAPLTRMLRLTGAVAFNGFDTTPVITQVSGPVSRIVVAPGQRVKRNQPLLYTASPDYSQLRSAYMKARDAYDLATKNYDRSKDLYNHHAIATRDLEAAESARNQALADLQSSEQALRILGLTQPDQVISRPPSPEIPVLAPIAGEIVERLVAPGQVIQAGATQCFTISNMSSVWVLANVYQKDLPYVHLGDAVTVSTDSYPGESFRGNISYIAAAVDPSTRTLQARITVKNPKQELKKDMYVVAMVRAGVVPNALTVPDAAILHDSENQPFVYVAGNNNQFARRPVVTGESEGGRTRIVSGVAPGERVVADGSLFLQFASSLQQ